MLGEPVDAEYKGNNVATHLTPHEGDHDNFLDGFPVIVVDKLNEGVGREEGPKDDSDADELHSEFERYGYAALVGVFVDSNSVVQGLIEVVLHARFLVAHL